MEEFHRIKRLPPYVFAEVNRLIKQFEQTRKVMKKLGSAPQLARGMGLPGLLR